MSHRTPIRFDYPGASQGRRLPTPWLAQQAQSNGDRVLAALASVHLPPPEVRPRRRCPPVAPLRPLQRRRRGCCGGSSGRDGGGAAAGECDQGEEGGETAGLAHEAGWEVHEELSKSL